MLGSQKNNQVEQEDEDDYENDPWDLDDKHSPAKKP